MSTVVSLNLSHNKGKVETNSVSGAAMTNIVRRSMNKISGCQKLISEKTLTQFKDFSIFSGFSGFKHLQHADIIGLD